MTGYFAAAVYWCWCWIWRFERLRHVNSCVGSEGHSEGHTPAQCLQDTHTHTRPVYSELYTLYDSQLRRTGSEQLCTVWTSHTFLTHTLVHESSLIATQINAPVSNDCRDFSSHNVFDGYTSGFRPGFALFLILFCLEFLYALLFHLFTASGQDIIVANNPLRGWICHMLNQKVANHLCIITFGTYAWEGWFPIHHCLCWCTEYVIYFTII